MTYTYPQIALYYFTFFIAFFFSLFLFRFLTQTPMSSCMLTVVTLDMAKQYDVSQSIPKRKFKIDVKKNSFSDRSVIIAHTSPVFLN